MVGSSFLISGLYHYEQTNGSEYSTLEGFAIHTMIRTLQTELERESSWDAVFSYTDNSTHSLYPLLELLFGFSLNSDSDTEAVLYLMIRTFLPQTVETSINENHLTSMKTFSSYISTIVFQQVSDWIAQQLRPDNSTGYAYWMVILRLLFLSSHSVIFSSKLKHFMKRATGTTSLEECEDNCMDMELIVYQTMRKRLEQFGTPVELSLPFQLLLDCDENIDAYRERFEQSCMDTDTDTDYVTPSTIDNSSSNLKRGRHYSMKGLTASAIKAVAMVMAGASTHKQQITPDLDCGQGHSVRGDHMMMLYDYAYRYGYFNDSNNQTFVQFNERYEAQLLLCHCSGSCHEKYALFFTMSVYDDTNLIRIWIEKLRLKRNEFMNHINVMSNPLNDPSNNIICHMINITILLLQQYDNGMPYQYLYDIHFPTEVILYKLFNTWFIGCFNLHTVMIVLLSTVSYGYEEAVIIAAVLLLQVYEKIYDNNIQLQSMVRRDDHEHKNEINFNRFQFRNLSWEKVMALIHDVGSDILSRKRTAELLVALNHCTFPTESSTNPT
jgi:hypothetical protein